MSYEVRFARSARKGLRRLRREDQKRIVRAAENLADDPRLSGAESVKGTPFLRVQVGRYRITYEVRDEELVVLIVRVGHRREVYRNL